MLDLMMPRILIKNIRSGAVKIQGRIFGVAESDILKAWCFCGIPLVFRQYSPNFKVKWYLGDLLFASLSRKPSFVSAKKEASYRKPRLYLSLGSLPFSDNGTGIPRVAKNLCREGLNQSEIDFVPVYPDPISGVYRCANRWCREQGMVSKNGSADFDCEITVRSGDWLVQTMVNPNALDFDARYLQSFRDAGGRIGVILYDLIAEEHPEFSKARDNRIFSRWLRQIVSFDAIFAISKTTELAFRTWLTSKKIGSCAKTGYFYLGADFKTTSEQSEEEPTIKLPDSPYFLQVSTLEPRKGYEQLISAFELLWKRKEDVNLVIVGRRGWKVAHLVQRIKRHPELNRRLFWFSHASDEELSWLYQHASGVVVASKAEGFGLPVIEGLWNGQRVIARDIPVFREVGGENLHYFSGDSAEPLADAVQCVLKDPSKTAILEGRDYSWKNSFKDFARLVKSFSLALDKENSL